MPFFAFPERACRIIYTTNAIEALNSKLRRPVRTRGHFPNDDAALKPSYLVLNHTAQDWKRPPWEWFEAKTQFNIRQLHGCGFYNHEWLGTSYNTSSDRRIKENIAPS